MEMSIDSKTENKLYERTQVAFSAKFEGPTPSRKAMRDEISKLTGDSADLIVITRVATEFGVQRAKGTANIYKAKESMSKSRKYLLVRNGFAEKVKKVKVKKATAAAPKSR